MSATRSKRETTPYRHVGAHVADLADGRLLELGTTYNLDARQVEDPHNARLIADGTLVSLDAAEPNKEEH